MQTEPEIGKLFMEAEPFERGAISMSDACLAAREQVDRVYCRLENTLDKDTFADLTALLEAKEAEATLRDLHYFCQGVLAARKNPLSP